MESTQDNEIKNEVVAAYNEVLRKLKVVKSGSDETKEDERQEDIITEQEKNVVDLAASETSNELVGNLSELRTYMSKTLDEIKFKLLPLYKRFETLREAIRISENELERLNGIKANAHTLTALLMAQREKAAEFNQEILEYRQAFAVEKANNEKQRRDEENEYFERRDKIRKQDQEQYDVMQQELEQELITRRCNFEEEFEAREARLQAREQEHQQMREREAWIVAREQEYLQLKEKAAYFPEEMRNNITKAERAVTDQLTRKYEYEAKLARIESESERKVYLQKITALEEQIEQYKKLKQAFSQSTYHDEEGN